MNSFEEFAEKRRLLQDFCARHYPSLERFSGGLSYRRNPEERDINSSDIKHLTSTVTCYSSLFQCPTRFKPSKCRNISDDAKRYANGAIQLPPEKWTSDGSAPIYCRCRALPFVIANISEWNDIIARYMEVILEQMNASPPRFAIGEAYPDRPQDEWYPPNAYHTYWALCLLDELQRRFTNKYDELENQLSFKSRAAQLLEWARKSLAYQVSLHCADSSVLDSDQLGWSLAIVLQFSNIFQANLSEQDFIRQAFACLFKTQTQIGSWRHYAPLFHYQKTGNAYCYIFETFAVLLQCALRPGAESIRTTLRAHFQGLVRLWQYACSTQVPIVGRGLAIGWSSGHRMNNLAPESWATASVFSYAQSLRRLVGIWARETALATLPKRNIYSTQDAAVIDLEQRTRTWTSETDLFEQLCTMFVNQVPSRDDDLDIMEPDSPPIRNQFARSAILYGPPGTSKTTIVRALAGVIGWDYVELHASHFVADGLPNVQRTADEIFRKLMELDRVIILFDEIDELVREREVGSDAFGRFLTTSMLPKLAELWVSRKIMYFVATNHINYFDRAITRGQRFDAVIFVSQPSFGAKIEQLAKLLSAAYGKAADFAFTKEDIDVAMPTFKSDKGLEKKKLPNRNTLAKFALVRWDELSELAFYLGKRIQDGASVDKELFSKALDMLSDSRLTTLREYFDYREGPKYARRDYGKENVWTVEGLGEAESPPGTQKIGRRTVYLTPLSNAAEIKIGGYTVTPLGRGTIRLQKQH